MANVSHASLTGSNLHEPKGADTAALGTVYVSNGAGGGTWSSVGTSAFTGMISDFAAPVAPAGWLELDGSVISTSTFAALYAVMSITTSGTRTNGSSIITSIPDTSKFKAGYFVFGTGLTTGSTILTVDSGTQITISNAATSSGSSAFAVSPWLLNTGTIKLPDVTTTGLYRRSRTSSTAPGQIQSSQNLTHTHTNTVSLQNNNHTHTGSGTTSGQSVSHTHGFTATLGPNGVTYAPNAGSSSGAAGAAGSNTGTASVDHSHTYSFTTATENGNHSHTVTIDPVGSSEARPNSIVLLTCVKT